jgi:hypothetical protein
MQQHQNHRKYPVGTVQASVNKQLSDAGQKETIKVPQYHGESFIILSSIPNFYTEIT